MRITQRAQRVEPFYVMELAKAAADMAAQAGPDQRAMIYLNIGEPDFTAPPLVQAAASRAIHDGRSQYTQATGLPALRRAISGWYASRFGLDIDPQRIVVTAGASAALQLACLTLIEAGDEVLMPDPSYPCNRQFVQAAEGRAVLLPAGPAERFQLSAEQVGAGLGAGHAGRLAGLALQPDRHLHRPARAGKNRPSGARPWRRDPGRRDLPGAEFRRRLWPQRAGPARRPGRTRSSASTAFPNTST